MTNKELLIKMGFFERDGWLCNPRLDGEAVFKLGDELFGCENINLERVAAMISVTAFNAGTRWQKIESSKQLAAKLRHEADILEGIIVDDEDD